MPRGPPVHGQPPPLRPAGGVPRPRRPSTGRRRTPSRVWSAGHPALGSSLGPDLRVVRSRPASGYVLESLSPSPRSRARAHTCTHARTCTHTYTQRAHNTHTRTRECRSAWLAGEDAPSRRLAQTLTELRREHRAGRATCPDLHRGVAPRPPQGPAVCLLRLAGVCSPRRLAGFALPR